MLFARFNSSALSLAFFMIFAYNIDLSNSRQRIFFYDALGKDEVRKR